MEKRIRGSRSVFLAAVTGTALLGFVACAAMKASRWS